MPRYRVRRAADISSDLERIEGYLVQVYTELGDDPESAMERAAVRIEDSLSYMHSFENRPQRGTEHPQIAEGIRTITNKRFIFYFEIDDLPREVRILAVFFGGIDHRKQIVERLRHQPCQPPVNGFAAALK